MDEQPYSLQPVARIIWSRLRTVALITLITVLAGLAVYLIRPRQYKANVEFFLKNPLYADRNYLYSSDARMIDYFAGDDDIERMKSMIWSDSVQDRIIRELRLAEAYDQDIRRPADLKALKKEFSGRINLYRTESKVAVLSYTDKDEERAAAVALRCVQVLEEELRGFYNGMRKSIYSTIERRIQEEDSTINILTDSLAALRDRYGIYDIISPARYNIMLSEIRDNGKPGFSRGIELVQNVESIKDQLVSDRAKHVTLAGQYATGTKMNELPIASILKVEKPPFKKEGPGLLAILIGCALAGFFFSLLYVLATHRYRKQVSTAA